MSGGVDWLVFGDDWGAHPSTTQHLVRHLPAEDRVIWVNSIGMRSPRLRRADLARVAGRLRSMWGGRPAATDRATPERVRVVTPRFVPFHDHAAARLANARLIGGAIDAARREAGMGALTALVSNPVAGRYLADLPVRRTGYLRLDDYPHLPGVDAALVEPAERFMFARADVVFGTARALLPPADAVTGRLCYLPQGVDHPHFAGPAHPVPASKVIGFFGLLAEWVDGALIAAAARACPDWTFEFVGPTRQVPAGLTDAPNVVLKPGVPYAALPQAIAHWRAGWVPFEVSTLTEGVNPLKLREYLAAGLPAASTPLPEAVSLGDEVTIVRDADDVARWVRSFVDADTDARRAARRRAMEAHGWSARARTLRAELGALP